MAGVVWATRYSNDYTAVAPAPRHFRTFGAAPGVGPLPPVLNLTVLGEIAGRNRFLTGAARTRAH